jgi:hypothetical protein
MPPAEFEPAIPQSKQLAAADVRLAQPPGWLIYPLHASNRETIHHQEAFTVYAAYGIYRAEDIFNICEKYTFLETSHKFSRKKS